MNDSPRMVTPIFYRRRYGSSNNGERRTRTWPRAFSTPAQLEASRLGLQRAARSQIIDFAVVEIPSV